MTAKELLHLQGISKSYQGVDALAGIDLTIYENEWVSIVGSSGSGKSTLLNIIGCISNATAGKLEFDGEDISRCSSRELALLRRDKIGFVFQQFHLVPYLTALENVMLAQYYHSLVAEGEAIAALEAVGLGDRLHHFPKQLSGGEQQRVCFARAIINDPRLILADEPTGNLDETNEAALLNLLRLAHQKGARILVVSHYETVAQEGQRTIELKHGKMISGS